MAEPGTVSWALLAQAAAGNPAARAEVRNAMSERVPSGGGFAVPEYLRGDMVLASLEDAIIRPLATVIPVSTLRTGLPQVDDTTHAGGSVFGGLTWSWTEEGQAIAASNATYSRGILEVKKLAAYLGGVPNELLEDGPAFDAFLRSAVPMGLAWAEDQAFIAGSGVGQPQGVLNAPCAIPVTRTTSLQADVANMITRMLPQSFKHCIWLCSPDKTGALLQIFLNFGSATTGVTAPSAWLTGNPSDGWTLLGRPVFFTEHVPASGTKGDLILVDPRFYVIADRKQMSIESSATGATFKLDETEFRFIERVDGRIWLQSPVTPQNSSATVSPVVILN